MRLVNVHTDESFEAQAIMMILEGVSLFREGEPTCPANEVRQLTSHQVEMQFRRWSGLCLMDHALPNFMKSD
jgi:hypothetical protein